MSAMRDGVDKQGQSSVMVSKRSISVTLKFCKSLIFHSRLRVFEVPFQLIV